MQPTSLMNFNPLSSDLTNYKVLTYGSFLMIRPTNAILEQDEEDLVNLIAGKDNYILSDENYVKESLIIRILNILAEFFILKNSSSRKLLSYQQAFEVNRKDIHIDHQHIVGFAVQTTAFLEQKDDTKVKSLMQSTNVIKNGSGGLL